jgi:hypothetical protein
MSTNRIRQKGSAAAAVVEGVPLTPEVMVEQLRAIRDQIPDFTQLPVPAAMALQRVANLNDGFVQAAINSAGASESVRSALGVTADQLQQQKSDAGRWSAVEDELRAMLRGVTAANLVRRHSLGVTALQTYSISRQLVRKSEHAVLLPHVDTMKRLNKLGHKRTPAQPVPPPAPAQHIEPQTQS